MVLLFDEGAGLNKIPKEPPILSKRLILISFFISETRSRGIRKKYVSRFPDFISSMATFSSK
jgi:hypothetical protein